MHLNDAPAGFEYIITSADKDCPYFSRLCELGIRKGALIAPLFCSLLGEPTAYRICGAVMALRKDEAAHIQVEKAGDYNGAHL